MFTLKNVKYAAFNSHETHCYQASLYLNGKKVADIENEGHGGPDMQWYVSKEAEKAVNEAVAGMRTYATDLEKANAIRTRIRRLADMGDAAFSHVLAEEPNDYLIEHHSDLLDGSGPWSWMNDNIESICCELVNDWLVAKEFKKVAAKRVLFTKKGEEGIYQTKPARNAKVRDQWALQIAQREDTDLVLNHMKTADAVELFRERC